MLGNSPQEIIQELNKQLEKLKTENRNLKQSQRFGIHFEHKPDDVVLSAKQNIPVAVSDTTRTVVPVAESSGVVDNLKQNSPVSHELRIGDNFLGLLTLLPNYAGKVNVIYIDPPYNTGKNDFIYNDKFVDGDDNYRHSKWLSFMEPRLKLAKKLLSEDGVIFVSIDDHEQAELKLLMNSIFGEENFIGAAPRKTRAFATTKGNAEMQTLSDYLLVYMKNRHKGVLKKRVVGEKTYPYNDARGQYYRVPLNDNGPHGYRSARPNLYYPIYKDGTGGVSLDPTDVDSVGTLPPLKSGREGRWMWSRRKFAAEHEDLEIKNGRVFIKHYYHPEEEQMKLQHEKLWIDNMLNTNGTKELRNIFGKNSKVFSYPKPTDLIKWCVSLHPSSDAIILDFFAGSGTTGQAVAELNAEDGGTRKCILITDEGKAKDDPEAVNIAEQITYERMRRVLTGKDWADGKDRPSLNQGLHVSHIKTVSTLLDNGEPVLKPELLLDIEDLLTENVNDDSIDENELEQLSSNIYATWRNSMRELGE